MQDGTCTGSKYPNKCTALSSFERISTGVEREAQRSCWQTDSMTSVLTRAWTRACYVRQELCKMVYLQDQSIPKNVPLCPIFNEYRLVKSVKRSVPAGKLIR